MKGAAPKSPATGSHVCPLKNPSPNLCCASRDCVMSSIRISTTTPSTDAAHISISTRNDLSASRVRHGSLRCFSTAAGSLRSLAAGGRTTGSVVIGWLLISPTKVGSSCYTSMNSALDRKKAPTPWPAHAEYAWSKPFSAPLPSASSQRVRSADSGQRTADSEERTAKSRKLKANSQQPKTFLLHL